MEEGKVLIEGSYEEIKNHDKFKAYAQSNPTKARETEETKEKESVAGGEISTGKLIGLFQQG